MNNFHNSFALKHGDVQPPFEKDIESMEKTVGSLVLSSINRTFYEKLLHYQM